MKTFLVPLFCAVLAQLNLYAADIAASKDHPLIKRFEGAQIVRYKFKKYDKYNLWEKGKWTPLEGTVTRIAYKAPPGSSSVEIFRNYEDEFKNLKVDPLLSGSSSEVGAEDNKTPWDIDIQGVQNNYEVMPWYGTKNSYFYVGKLTRPEGDLYICLVVAELTKAFKDFKPDDVLVTLDVVEIKSVEKKMVEVKAADMAKALASAGKIDLYGIYFDTDKTDIKLESEPTLAEVTKLLTNDPVLRLRVVGHTDNVGGEKYNDTLSQGRASAVVIALTKRGIATDRLIPEGKGFREPVASNDTEEGRAKNRRVELVKL